MYCIAYEFVKPSIVDYSSIIDVLNIWVIKEWNAPGMAKKNSVSAANYVLLCKNMVLTGVFDSVLLLY